MMQIQDLNVGDYYVGHLGGSSGGNQCFWAFVTEAKTFSNVLHVVYQHVRQGTSWHTDRLAGRPTDKISFFVGLVQKSQVLTAGFPECPEEVATRQRLLNSVLQPITIGSGGPTVPCIIDPAKAIHRAFVPENKNRTACFRCSGPTKTIQLFTGTTKYCPVCEP